MEIVIGLIIIAIGAFCQSSCYVPINKIKDWSWESYWIIQGVFAWLVLPFLGALLAVPAGHSLFELFTAEQSFNIWMTIFFGVLWGVGGLTFGLSMRYLGVALGQSIALGTCAGLGTIMGPVLLNMFFPELNALESLTFAVSRQGLQLPEGTGHRLARRIYERLLQCRSGIRKGHQFRRTYRSDVPYIASNPACDIRWIHHQCHLLFLSEPSQQDLGRLQEDSRMGQ